MTKFDFTKSMRLLLTFFWIHVCMHVHVEYLEDAVPTRPHCHHVIKRDPILDHVTMLVIQNKLARVGVAYKVTEKREKKKLYRCPK